MRSLLCLAVVLGLGGVARGQTITLAGFSGADGGWTSRTEVFNGQWTSGQAQPNILPFGPNNFAGGMVTATRNSSGWTVTLYHNSVQGYVPFAVIGVYGANGTTTLPRGPGDPRPARTISVQ